MWRLTVRGQEVCWRSSEEGQQNCKLKVGDGVGALSSLCTVLPDCRLLRLGSCEILERGGRLVGVIPSADTCLPDRDELTCPLILRHLANVSLSVLDDINKNSMAHHAW